MCCNHDLHGSVSVNLINCYDTQTVTIKIEFGEYTIYHYLKNSVDFRKNLPID